MKTNISRERVKRWVVFFLSLFFMGNGIALVTNAQLGTTPISSVPYVIARIFGISMGTGTFCINVLMLLAQIPLLGKTFRARQFLQLPCVFVFSLFIDLGLWLSHAFIPEAWLMRMAMTLTGCVIMAFGIMLEIASSTTVIPGEGFVLALASSKPEEMCVPICEKFGFTPSMETITGSPPVGDWSKADVIRETMRRLELTDAHRASIVMVGDRKFDVLGARACGIDCVGVEFFGYAAPGELAAAGAVAVVRTAEELERFLLEH